ncbi:restriction endonuclease [Streptomyces alboniger]|uniref:Restriction endonuclease n=1 Tax=Streptomyces alboniger TaxID=132473 RepID=A0A5J6HPM1_STRAD|nr:restriction endonuclease [Streptomyces alboniger]QEV21142.1 restriction endonuclease [Streptomyces alboniger]
MFDEDGRLDPFLKTLLYGVFALAIGKMLWKWLTGTAVAWILNGPWAWLTGHPWWAALICAGALVMLVAAARAVLVVLGFAGGYVGPPPAAPPALEPDTADVSVTFRMRELAAMSPTEFEQACAELLVRDGFTDVQRVGGPGDLGADVRAVDSDGDLVILQCKRYRARVTSGHVQQFNGTARPHHGADVAIMIGLAGFTDPAATFARQHHITVLGRAEIKKWAHGTHLYQAVHVLT